MFHSDFNIPLGNIALIPAVFYVTQLGVDLICAKYVDSIGYRKSIVASQLFAGLGLIGLAVLPNIISPYVGILIECFFTHSEVVLLRCCAALLWKLVP